MEDFSGDFNLSEQKALKILNINNIELFLKFDFLNNAESNQKIRKSILNSLYLKKLKILQIRNEPLVRILNDGICGNYNFHIPCNKKSIFGVCSNLPILSNTTRSILNCSFQNIGINLPESDQFILIGDYLPNIGCLSQESIELILCSSFQKIFSYINDEQAFDHILHFISEYSGLNSDDLECSLIQYCQNVPIINDEKVLNLLKYIGISPIYCPVSLCTFLQRNRINFSNIVSYTEKTLFEHFGFNYTFIKVLISFYSLKNYALSFLTKFNVSNEYYFNSVSKLLECHLKHFKPKQKILKTLSLFFKKEIDERGFTLEQIGLQIGMTRERIRQIISKWLPLLASYSSKEKLVYLRILLSNGIYQNGGAISFFKFKELFNEKILSNDKISSSLLHELIKDLPEVCIQDNIITLNYYPCKNCNNINKVFSFINIRELPLQITTLSEIVSNSCKNIGCNFVYYSNKISSFFIKSILTNTNILMDNNLCTLNEKIISENDYNICTLPADELVPYFMKNTPLGLHYSEIASEINTISNKITGEDRISKIRVHQILITDKNILMCGRGKYIHKSHFMDINFNQSEIAQYIKHEFEKGKPFTTAYQIFKKYKETNPNGNIPNEQALYDYFRETSKTKFLMPHFPYIYKNKNYTEENIISILETYVINEGRPVEYNEIEDFIQNEYGFKYPLALIQNSPNLIRVDTGKYEHLENIDLHNKHIKELIATTRNMVEKFGHISSEKIYDENKITCFEAGIHNSIMLLSILERASNGQFNFGRTHISMIQNSSQQQINTISNMIVNYLNEQGRLVSTNEIREHFSEDRGYNSTMIYNTLFFNINKNNILQYAQNLYATNSILGIDEIIVKQILEISHKFSKEQTTTFYSKIDAVIESGTLPTLKNRIPWSKYLLANILEQSGKFVIVGNAKATFLPFPNNKDIEDFGDFIYWIVKENFNEVAELDILSDFLYNEGIVMKRLTPFMLESAEKVRFQNNKVYTIELEEYVERIKA